jgi:hypothetical protein
MFVTYARVTRLGADYRRFGVYKAVSHMFVHLKRALDSINKSQIIK